MESILPAYNDPLFSILLIIVIALIITLMTYGWGLYSQQKEEGKLLKFLEKFDGSECTLNTTDMPFESTMLKPLTLLAKAFENSGEYPKAINIYLYLIKHIHHKAGEIELMERLGNTYLHAGFLERAKSIYLEILRRNPRNIKVLYEIGIVYEALHEYDKAKEIIEPLTILGEQTSQLAHFFDFAQLMDIKNMETSEKVEKLNLLLEKEPSMYRSIVSALLDLDLKSAWKIIDPKRSKELLDILWFLPNSQLDLDTISSNDVFHTLYYAKGYLQSPKIASNIFSLDMLATARQGGFEGGDLVFSFLCNKCKQHFPVSFRRCPSCTAIHSLKVEESIVKLTPKTNHSLL
ncbi:MAG: hypothetical protein Q9M36_13145 [Sulfurovum sp.]|nr:hypothetical protein [Sulfurovum sp.]